ncbi:MAG: disulfide bond formation protein DsbA [Magnetococcales bacterium]|nr:disulfide bond formation protein DsbA [Magnetococcales bacterium]|tara:strand:+ start:160575 stop:161369 length:795 start_codon:yes stop_codon:yes gene_type:complete
MSTISSEAKRNVVLLSIATLFTIIVLAGTVLFSVGTRDVQASNVDEARVNELIERYIDKNIGDIHTKLIKYIEDQQNGDQQQATADAFENPLPNLIRDWNPTRGAKNADITIVDYSEFQCPFCGRSRGTLDELAKRYEGKIQIVYKNFPLDFHPEAVPAAKAAYAANKQGKFWEFHDVMFANQQNLSEDLYVKTARDLGLDIEKFNADRNSADADAAIKQDAADGTEIGVRGTPFFLINGVPLSGAQPVAAFEAVIQQHLANME